MKLYTSNNLVQYFSEIIGLFLGSSSCMAAVFTLLIPVNFVSGIHFLSSDEPVIVLISRMEL